MKAVLFAVLRLCEIGIAVSVLFIIFLTFSSLCSKYQFACTTTSNYSVVNCADTIKAHNAATIEASK